MYATVEALESTGQKNHQELADKWSSWLEYTKDTAREVSN